MVKKRPETFIVSQDSFIITDTVSGTYNELKSKFNYHRISDFPILLAKAFNLDSFEFFDTKTWNDPRFISYLMDKQIEFQSGLSIDLAQLHTDILNVYEFTSKEKFMFIEGDIEDRILAIFLLITNKII